MRRLLAFLAFSLAAFAADPVLFFTDLDSGPKTGGDSNNGVYVTLYGLNFGTTRNTSTVKLNGVEVASYARWDDAWMTGDRVLEKITVQLGSGVSTGNFVVNVGGVNSNGIAFTVRSGNIYFVAATGNDSNSGLSGSPWLTILHARGAIAAGDTVYLNNVSQTTDDGSGWSTCMLLDANAGTAGNPKAFVNYPGATGTIGSNTACPTGIRSKATGSNYWTFAGLNVLGGGITFNTYNEHDWRLVGNDLTCPNGNGQAGCLDTGGTGLGFNFKVYGNNLHNAGTNNSPGSVTALYHGYYISEGQHDIDVGWNTFRDVYGGRCVQENVNEGTNVYNLWIHDNVIHDCQNDGIVLATMLEPGLGAIEVYNNIIYNAGKGPNNAEGTGSWACVNAQGWDAGAGSGGAIEVYNNTMYACGTFSSPPYVGSSGGFAWEDGNVAVKSVRLRNNAIQLTTGPSDFRYMNVYQPNTSTCSSTCSHVTGSNNIFFGFGTNPTNNVLTASVNSDPLFTAPASHDFSLQNGSPAATGGVTTSRTADFNGIPLPQGAGYPIGALALSASTSVPTVTSTAASSITTTTASAGGNVTSDGGASVTSRGTCYATTSNPTSPCTSDGTGTGAFTSSITGLTASTLYHIRAFATNSAGTSYGSDLTFTTSAIGQGGGGNGGKITMGGKISVGP